MMITMMLMNLRLAENELFTDLIGDLLICFVSPVLFKNCVLLGFMVSLNILVHNKDMGLRKPTYLVLLPSPNYNLHFWGEAMAGA